MNTKISETSIYHSGYCKQLKFLAGEGLTGIRRFYSNFVLFKHYKHGYCLVDTGYSPRFFEATKAFPYRFYRWMTPATIKDNQFAKTILSKRGITPKDIKKIFVSHFHGDHICGLKDFPLADIVFIDQSYNHYQGLSSLKKTRHAFLPELIPHDFTSRADALKEEKFVDQLEGFERFQLYDYFADGSLFIVNLPGHSRGHAGVIICEGQHKYFYIADAAWSLNQLATASMPWVTRSFLDSTVQYDQNQSLIKDLTTKNNCKIFACHCEHTEALVSHA